MFNSHLAFQYVYVGAFTKTYEWSFASYKCLWAKKWSFIKIRDYLLLLPWKPLFSFYFIVSISVNFYSDKPTPVRINKMCEKASISLSGLDNGSKSSCLLRQITLPLLWFRHWTVIVIMTFWLILQRNERRIGRFSL